VTTLSPGSRLGPYEVLEPIGAGGMGEVYKASDTRLARTVAIKILGRRWTTNAEMRQRFEREAHTLGSLNHPHICVLHDIGSHAGTDFLVMEYLEGETLAARLERGPVAFDEALNYALEIADALDKAHRRGVVHRDLKPSNVMLTKSGTKLLDFGLAKWAEPGTSTSVTQTPTAMPTGKDITSPGTVLGTLQYMAPEQLEGLEADARTDIFAFGALLHEMVTGRKAFEGKSRVLLIAAIATSEPPALSTLEPAASRALDHVVKTCLAKEPADRWQTARDVLAELEWVAAGGDTTAAGASAPWRQRRAWVYRAVLAVTGLLVGVGAASAARYFQGTAISDELRFRVPIQLSAESTVAGGAGNNPSAPNGYRGVSGIGVFNPRDAVVSPDGRNIVFAARQNNFGGNTAFLLYVRPVGAVTPQRLDGTENAQQPFWSADGRSIGFLSEGKLKRVDKGGGPPQEIATLGSLFGGTWNPDGTILFGSAEGIQRVPAEGGKPETIIPLADSETGLYWPHFLPDGRHFLYTSWSGQGAKRAIMAASIDLPTQKTRVLPIGSNAGYSEPGYVVFHRGNAVYAQPFDAATLAASGEPTRIADEVTFDGSNGLGHFSVSAERVITYFFGSDNPSGTSGAPQSDLSEWQLSWFTRTNQLVKSVGPPGVYRGVEAFAKTDRVAVHRHDVNGGDVVVFEPNGSLLRLTTDAAQHNSMPIWSPDGTQIVFASLRSGKWGLYTRLSTGSGTEQKIYESDLPAAPMSWNGKYIVFWVQDPKMSGDIGLLKLEGDQWKAEKLIATPYNETHPQISPDGKWIAFVDNSKDNRPEIFVQPFPTGTGKFQISDNAGDWPRWKGDSKEIYYHSIGNTVQTLGISAGEIVFNGVLYSVAVRANGPALEKDPVKQILITPLMNLPHSGGSYSPYAVSPDGERFLIPQFAPSAAAAANSQIGPDTFSGLTIAVNWPSSLKLRK